MSSDPEVGIGETRCRHCKRVVIIFSCGVRNYCRECWIEYTKPGQRWKKNQERIHRNKLKREDRAWKQRLKVEKALRQLGLAQAELDRALARDTRRIAWWRSDAGCYCWMASPCPNRRSIPPDERQPCPNRTPPAKKRALHSDEEETTS